MVQVQIVGGRDGKIVEVTKAGTLAVGPLKFEETEFRELAVNDTAYNFYEPLPGKNFVITGLRGKADRDVSPTVDADVVIYEASSIDTTTVDKVLHREALIRAESFTLTSLNVLVRQGKWLNAKTTDDDIHMIIMGYYIDAVD